MVGDSLKKEKSMVDLAYEILQEEKQPLPFRDIVTKTNEIKQWAEEDYEEQIARLYTNLNIDGRFLPLQDNHWALKAWYPVGQQEEEIVISRKKKKSFADDEELDDLSEVDEDLVDEELEDEDYIDEEEDEAFDPTEEDEDYDYEVDEERD